MMNELFSRAVNALQSGHLREALELSQQLISQSPQESEALHLAGVIALESGQLEQGEKLLTKAAAIAPNNPEIYYNHGCALMKLDDNQRAKGLLQQCLKLAPGHISALNNLGAVYERQDQNEKAMGCYHQVLAKQPNNTSALYNLGHLCLRQEKALDAVALLKRSASLRPTHCDSWLILSEALLTLGELNQAIQAAKKATEVSPDTAIAWTALGRAENMASHREACLAAHQKALLLEPENPDLFNNLGSALTNLSLLDEAEKALKQALERSSEHRLAIINLVALDELANRLDDCMYWISRGLKLFPDDVNLILSEAKCLHRNSQHEKALLRLQQLSGRADLDPQTDKDMAFLNAAILDRLGRESQAFDEYRRGNQIAGEMWRRIDTSEDQFVRSLEQIRQVFPTDYCKQVREPKPKQEKSPAFLLGFQRSGTTLLDTMLGGHSKVSVMEEQPVLNRVISHMCERFGDYPEALPRLDNAALAELRTVYFEQAIQLSDWNGSSESLLLDKSPLHTVHLGLIHQLFPQAPIILALRHPYDVCLSCFMQDFAMNPFMLHYLSVEGVAKVYEKVMSLWFYFSQQLAFPRFELKYEALVERPEDVLRTLVSFLDLDWEPALADHRSHAMERGLINTPSYHQVTKAVYRSARYRWKRYQPQMQEAIKTLAPFAEKFGYES